MRTEQVCEDGVLWDVELRVGTRVDGHDGYGGARLVVVVGNLLDSESLKRKRGKSQAMMMAAAQLARERNARVETSKKEIVAGPYLCVRGN